MGNHSKQDMMVPERRVVTTDRFRLMRRLPRNKREWWLEWEASRGSGVGERMLILLTPKSRTEAVTAISESVSMGVCDSVPSSPWPGSMRACTRATSGSPAASAHRPTVWSATSLMTSLPQFHITSGSGPCWAHRLQPGARWSPPLIETQVRHTSSHPAGTTFT